MNDLVTAVAAGGIPLALVAYVLLQPDKAQRVAGWAWSLISGMFRIGDRTAVALRVQGEINASRARLMKHAPGGLLDSKLRIKWNDAEAAQAVIGNGEVLVCMRRSKHHEENVAHALMAYLPKAVIPRARRYVDRPTMQAADLTLARSILTKIDERPGALDVFFDEHLDPARDASTELSQRIAEVDEIDLHGWLIRALLPEFQHLGDQLHPGDPDSRCIADAQAFVGWLYRLAAREPGDDTLPLSYEGRFIRVAVVLVAQRQKLLEKGTEPYRKQAKRLIYEGGYDAVYLMGRDDNIYAVKAIYEQLKRDGRVAAAECHEYRLRPDFRKRKLDRETAVIASLRPHHRDGRRLIDPGEELPEVEVERFDPWDDGAGPLADGAATGDDGRVVARFQRALARHASERRLRDRVSRTEQP